MLPHTGAAPQTGRRKYPSPRSSTNFLHSPRSPRDDPNSNHAYWEERPPPSFPSPHRAHFVADGSSMSTGGGRGRGGGACERGPQRPVAASLVSTGPYGMNTVRSPLRHTVEEPQPCESKASQLLRTARHAAALPAGAVGTVGAVGAMGSGSGGEHDVMGHEGEAGRKAGGKAGGATRRQAADAAAAAATAAVAAATLASASSYSPPRHTDPSPARSFAGSLDGALGASLDAHPRGRRYYEGSYRTGADASYVNRFIYSYIDLYVGGNLSCLCTLVFIITMRDYYAGATHIVQYY